MTTSGRFLAATPAIDGLGIGLTNTRSRLAMLYGERFAFRMTNQDRRWVQGGDTTSAGVGLEAVLAVYS